MLQLHSILVKFGSELCHIKLSLKVVLARLKKLSVLIVLLFINRTKDLGPFPYQSAHRKSI